MPQDTCQNGKTAKWDDIELSHAWDPRTSRCVDVWHVHTSCYPHSTPRPRPATPSTSHGDLQQDTAASLPGKARLHGTLGTQHEPQKPLHRLRYPNAHLEGGLGRIQWNVQGNEWGWVRARGTGDPPDQVGRVPVKTLKCWLSRVKRT